MKKQWIVLWVVAMTIPALAQQTNHFRKGTQKNKKSEHVKITEQQRKERIEKKYHFLEKSLTQMGVSAEDKIKIRNLQIKHREKMRINMQRINNARKKLSKLENSGADEDSIEQAIQEIANAQAAQLRVLVGNRREMKNILGKEKYAHFMENARIQYRKHDNRSGTGIPPRPGLPPLPNSKTLPPSPIEEYLRFMDHAREQYLKKRQARGAKPPTPKEYIHFMDRTRERFFKNHPLNNSNAPSSPPKNGPAKPKN